MAITGEGQRVGMDPDQVRQQWGNRTGAYSPEYYAYFGPDETSEQLLAQISSSIETDNPILELGCSAGRHLAHLFDHGYRNLYGIDINADAFSVMEESYPELADVGSFYTDAIGAVLQEFSDGRFDVVYSVETLQHLHPNSDWVLTEIARVTNSLLMTVESEIDDSDDDPSVVPTRTIDEVPLYYRDWNRIFSELGFTQIEQATLDGNEFRVFETRADTSPPR